MGCPSGKRIYGNERVANRAVSVAANRGELPPMRHYRCPDCGHWHLSKKTRPSIRLNSEQENHAALRHPRP